MRTRFITPQASYSRRSQLYTLILVVDRAVKLRESSIVLHESRHRPSKITRNTRASNRFNDPGRRVYKEPRNTFPFSRRTSIAQLGQQRASAFDQAAHFRTFQAIPRNDRARETGGRQSGSTDHVTERAATAKYSRAGRHGRESVWTGKCVLRGPHPENEKNEIAISGTFGLPVGTCSGFTVRLPYQKSGLSAERPHASSPRRAPHPARIRSGWMVRITEFGHS